MLINIEVCFMVLCHFSMDELLTMASESNLIKYLLNHKRSKSLGIKVVSNIYDNPCLSKYISFNCAFKLFEFLSCDMYKNQYLLKLEKNHPKSIGLFIQLYQIVQII